MARPGTRHRPKLLDLQFFAGRARRVHPDERELLRLSSLCDHERDGHDGERHAAEGEQPDGSEP